ncbi:flagellar biosynthesis protein FlgN [Aestuariivita sp.]|jgi:flagellar biosynthesis/type III secretory pathway chaperone|uniref:flagellar biosynthesis protein FlgN n=1 Tax=Aestuariivita sp. TaxID=1872407 RepID=UPI00216FF02D|nr:flagellar biosynthesis protein FlgN [Aestuariivita sp.]MCE8006481.1 flagellar biosynthesis protein FlgN [Aestuariivita sp.]
MTTDTPQDLIDALDALLETERSALLAGNVAEINRLADHKEGLIDKLNALSDLAPPTLAPLHDKLTRNQTLIASALEGIRAVADRMAEMRSVRQSLQTYDRSGTIQEIAADPKRTVEKRA